LLAFAGSIEAGQDWIQCFYTVANPATSWRTRLMAYAFSLFNGVTPLGQSVLGLSAGFRGNGMCFSTRSLKLVPWRSFGLVEDMEYSWNVRIAGGKIAFLPDVRVLGVMLGQGGKPAASQRRRWEFGRRDVGRRVLVPLLRSTHHESGLDGSRDLPVPRLPTRVELFVDLALPARLRSLEAAGDVQGTADAVGSHGPRGARQALNRFSRRRWDPDSQRDWSRTRNRRQFLAGLPQWENFLQAGTWPYAATAQELECGTRAQASCQHGPKPLRIDEKVGLIC